MIPHFKIDEKEPGFLVDSIGSTLPQFTMRRGLFRNSEQLGWQKWILMNMLRGGILLSIITFTPYKTNAQRDICLANDR